MSEAPHPGGVGAPVILIDSRERLPYVFGGLRTERRKLDAGDYSLVGYENRTAVERKSQTDAYGVVGKGRARFERCLARLERLERPAIVIECTLAEFAVPPPQVERITGAMAVGSFISWSCQYRIPVFWCGSRAAAERVTLRWLVAYLKHVAPATKC